MMAAWILMAFAALTPVFLSRISATPFWLALQALAMAWLLLGASGHAGSHALLPALEVILVRGLLVPWLLHRQWRNDAATHGGLMQSNLFAWGLAIALLLMAVKFADSVPDAHRALALGVIAGMVMMALLILASNPLLSAQLVAVLLTENALLLFETLMPQAWPAPVHVVLSLAYLATAGVGIRLLRASRDLRMAQPVTMPAQESPRS